MQEKHAWDKLLTLTGNIEEDFQKVIVLLEEHDITNPLFIKTTPVAFPKEMPKIRTSLKSYGTIHLAGLSQIKCS